jgi:uncharacterized membrane protein
VHAKVDGMATLFDPAAAQALETLRSVHTRLNDAVTRLDEASRTSRVLADQTNWRTDAATLFHTNADAWRGDVARLSGAVESARDDVARVRARVESHLWGYAG